MYRSLSLSASSRYRWNKKVQEFQGVFSPSGGRKEKQLVSLSADPFHLRKHERSEETMRWKDIRSLDKITVLWCPIFPLFFIITILLIFFFLLGLGVTCYQATLLSWMLPTGYRPNTSELLFCGQDEVLPNNSILSDDALWFRPVTLEFQIHLFSFPTDKKHHHTLGTSERWTKHHGYCKEQH